MGRKGKKFKQFTTENIELITAKKLQEKEANKTGQKQSKKNASSITAKSGSSHSHTGDSSTSSAPSELVNTDILSSENSNVLRNQINLPQDLSSLDIKEADTHGDKFRVSEQVTNQAGDTEAIDLYVNLNASDENTKNNLKENSNEIEAEIQCSIALKNATIVASTTMEPDARVPKQNPDNPAWISGTCSPPAAVHPFNSLNPHAHEFRPREHVDSQDYTPTKPEPSTNSSVIQPSTIPNAITDLPTQQVQQNTDCGNTIPSNPNFVQEPVVPGHKNIGGPLHNKKMNHGEKIRDGDDRINEINQPNIQKISDIQPDKIPNVSSQATAENHSDAANCTVHPDLKNSTTNWSSKRSFERASNESDDRRRNENPRYQYGQHNSQYGRGRNNQKGGGRRNQDDIQGSQSENINTSLTTSSGGGSHQDNEDNHAELQERYDGNGGKLDSNANHHRQQDSFDNSNNRSFSFKSGTGQGWKQDGLSRNDKDGLYRPYNRSRGHGSRGKPRPREYNSEHIDEGHYESHSSGNDWESTPTTENRRDEVKIDNKNQNWRDRPDYSIRQSDNYYGNTDKSHNFSRQGDNKSRYYSGNVRGGGNKRFSKESRGRDNVRGRNGGRGSNRNCHNKDSYGYRRSSIETPEIVNDESSKESIGNYHITDDESNESPEKTWNKSDVSQNTNTPGSDQNTLSTGDEDWDKYRTNDEVAGNWGTADSDGAWDGDWNNSVDLPQPNFQQDNVTTLPETSSNKQEAQGNVANISEERHDSRSSRRTWGGNSTKGEEKVKSSQSRHSYDSSDRSHERGKPRRSYDNQRKYVDPRQERENANRSADDSNRSSDGNQGIRPSERPLRQMPMTAYVDTDKDSKKRDQEFSQWEATWRDINEFQVVSEIQGNLFEQPKDFSLAHCVAEDLRMGSGIAVDFKREFKNLPELLDQRAKQGGLATLHDEKNNRFVYYLITKRESTGKPTYQTLWRSLDKMRTHIQENEVKNLAVPRIGCGLDRLEWKQVKSMLEFLFRNVPVQITVCNFQQDEEIPKKSITCKLVVEEYPVTKIAPCTLIFYFSTADGHVDDNMQKLSQKFNFLSTFKSHKPKNLGDIVYSEDKEYGLCGCVVRKTHRDPISFTSLSKCVREFNKLNKKHGNDAFQYVSFQWINESDDDDDLINQKIITILINQLRNVDVYVCRGRFEDEE